jgi:hypothetical protein
MAGGPSKLAFKLLSAIVAIPVSRAIRKATAKAWVTARPDNPPHDPRKVETSWQDALIWAGVTGFGAALAQLLTTKGADTVWRAATGKPSPRPNASSKQDAQAA